MQHCDQTGNGVSEDLRLLAYWAKGYYESMTRRLHTLQSRGMTTFAMLSLLFVLDEALFKAEVGGCRTVQCGRLSSCTFEHDETDGRYMAVQFRVIDCCRGKPGYVEQSSKILYFKGEKRIQSLPIYPLRYHIEWEDIRGSFAKIGRRFFDLTRPNFVHAMYDGNARYLKGENVLYSNIKGRIIIDSESVWEYGQRSMVPETLDQPAISNTDKIEEDDLICCVPIVRGFSPDKSLWRM